MQRCNHPYFLNTPHKMSDMPMVICGKCRYTFNNVEKSRIAITIDGKFEVIEEKKELSKLENK